ncbi:MAG: bifunctional nuclease family protein [Verrucomicrobiales bacterium]|jgi:bifunctional DNase/RNase|nr:bifunctional nuclease family protein [Verrucomicrobiales bacterium]
MTEALIEVRILGLMPSGHDIAVFLGNEEKVFSIHVDGGVGANIALILQGNQRERPLTHDLIGLIFKAFAISVERVVINDLRNDIYYARLILKMDDAAHTRITEIDARPSDCLAIALETGKRVFVTPKVWREVSDLSATLEEMQHKLECGAIDDLLGNACDEEDADDGEARDDDQASGKS